MVAKIQELLYGNKENLLTLSIHAFHDIFPIPGHGQHHAAKDPEHRCHIDAGDIPQGGDHVRPDAEQQGRPGRPLLKVPDAVDHRGHLGSHKDDGRRDTALLTATFKISLWTLSTKRENSPAPTLTPLSNLFSTLLFVIAI